MAELQTVETDASVDAFIDSVENETRRSDARTMVAIMSEITGMQPRMWGPAIIGFGRYKFRETKKGGDFMPRVAFSPRKANLVLYLARDENTDAMLQSVGKCKTSTSCIYLNKLADTDSNALRKLVHYSWDLSMKRDP